MSAILPTLTLDGYVSEPTTLLIKLYEYFITSDYSQTVSFYGKISSLRYLIRKHGSNMSALEEDIRDVFTKLVSSYITNLEVPYNSLEIEVIVSPINDTEIYLIDINVSVYINNVLYELKRSIDTNSESFIHDSNRIEYLITGEVYNG